MTVASAIGGLSPFLPARYHDAASERARQRRSLAPVEPEVVHAQVLEPPPRDVVSVRVEVVASERAAVRAATDVQAGPQGDTQREQPAPLPFYDSAAMLALIAETPGATSAALGFRAIATAQRAAAAYGAHSEYAPPSLPTPGHTLNLRA